MQKSSPIDLKNFQLTYDIAEDRLKFIVSGFENKETCLWLTRRLVQKVWPTLVDVLKSHVKAIPDDALHEVSENQLSQTHVERRFEYRDSHASKIIFYGTKKKHLVAKVEIKIGEDSNVFLTLADLYEQGVQISLTVELLLTLCQIIAKSIEASDWGLNLRYRNLFSDGEDLEIDGDAQLVKTKQSKRLN